MSELTRAEQLAAALANQTDLRWRARGISMTPRFQLALYHWIKNGRATCPGGECCERQE